MFMECKVRPLNLYRGQLIVLYSSFEALVVCSDNHRTLIRPPVVKGKVAGDGLPNMH
jgi:hypothetical protein